MIDPLDQNSRDRLRIAVDKNFTMAEWARRNRRELVAQYHGQPLSEFEKAIYRPQNEPLFPLVQQAVSAHILSLAWRGPRFSVVSRILAGKQTAKGMQMFLNKYSAILDLPTTLRRLALDSAFGWAAAKVVIGPAPAGVNGSPVAPRCWRIDPTLLLYDSTASSFDEVLYIGDTYLMDLEEARNFQGFRADQRQFLQEYTGFNRSTSLSDVSANTDRYASPMTRLVDIYLPHSGLLCTWPATMDQFGEISQEPLAIQKVAVNPYSVLSLMDSAGGLTEVATMSATRGLADLTNDLGLKTANQARQAKRNPAYKIGSEQDAAQLINAPDLKPIGVAELGNIGLYTIPGPDPNVIAVMQMALNLFKQFNGNVDLSLGNASVSGTARQEQILAERVSARENVSRQRYEQFVGEIGRKLATLAFSDEIAQIELQEPVPGMPGITLDYSTASVPRVGTVDDYSYDVVPYSTQYRSPEERIAQLQEATAEVMQILGAVAAGAPLNIQVILEQIAEYRELPELIDWWTGQQPTPQESAQQTMSQMAPQGSTVQYQGVGNSGGVTPQGMPVMGDTPPAGGMSVLGAA